MIKTAIKISLTAKNRTEILVGVRRRGFLKKIKHVNRFPRKAKRIRIANIVPPTAFSILECWNIIKFLLVFIIMKTFENENVVKVGGN